MKSENKNPNAAESTQQALLSQTCSHNRHTHMQCFVSHSFHSVKSYMMLYSLFFFPSVISSYAKFNYAPLSHPSTLLDNFNLSLRAVLITPLAPSCVFAAILDIDPCMYFGLSGVLTDACPGLRLSYALDFPALLDLITLWTLFGLRLDHDGHRHFCYGLGLTTQLLYLQDQDE